MNIEENLKNIVGKKFEKEFLIDLRNRYDYDDKVNSHFSGVMLSGKPNSGKTLLMKALAESFDQYSFISLKGNFETDSEQITKFFSNFKNKERYVLALENLYPEIADFLIDELIIRSHDKLIIIATRDDSLFNSKLNAQLFDYKLFTCELKVSMSDEDMIKESIISFFKDHNLHVPTNENLETVVNNFLTKSYQDIQLILNKEYEAKGKHLSIFNIDPLDPYCFCHDKSNNEREYCYSGTVPYEKCVALAGHILCAYRHSENTTFESCKFYDRYHANIKIYHDKEKINSIVKAKRFDCPYFQETKIEIAMAGYLSQAILLKKYSKEEKADYKEVIDENLNEIVASCYMDPIYNVNSKTKIIDKNDKDSFNTSKIKKIKHKLYLKNEKNTKMWLNDNKEKLKKIADHLAAYKSIDLLKVGDAIGGIIYVNGQNDF